MWIAVFRYFVKVCIIRLDHISKKNIFQIFDKYAVAHTENEALVKSTMKIFSNFVAFSENPNFITGSIYFQSNSKWNLKYTVQNGDSIFD